MSTHCLNDTECNSENNFENNFLVTMENYDEEEGAPNFIDTFGFIEKKTVSFERTFVIIS